MDELFLMITGYFVVQQAVVKHLHTSYIFLMDMGIVQLVKIICLFVMNLTFTLDI